jgi:hypothetical protein
MMKIVALDGTFAVKFIFCSENRKREAVGLSCCSEYRMGSSVPLLCRINVI